MALGRDVVVLETATGTRQQGLACTANGRYRAAIQAHLRRVESGCTTSTSPLHLDFTRLFPFVLDAALQGGRLHAVGDFGSNLL